jgi:hypothetical protein
VRLQPELCTSQSSEIVIRISGHEEEEKEAREQRARRMRRT